MSGAEVGGTSVLTLRRAATVVVVSIVIALTVRVAIMLVTFALALSGGIWGGIITTFVITVAASLASFALAVAGVATGVRYRGNSRRFTQTFAAMLAVVTIVPFIGAGWGAVLFPIHFDESPTWMTALVTVPLLLTVPAARCGLLRWRTVGFVAAAGLAIAIGSIVVIAGNTVQ